MKAFSHLFIDLAPVKEIIESHGVPHTEVDLILANGESVGFSYVVRDGDRISVYPVFEALDITPLLRLRPKPLREPRFVLDTHLGRLAAYLRMLGFDTVYEKETSDAELARISHDEHRILLTRDRGLLKRGAVTHGYYVRETQARKQLMEVVRRFDLATLLQPFTRCLRCNSTLYSASKDNVRDLVPERSAGRYEQFWRCPGCERVYWQGSHYRRMRNLIESVIEGQGSPSL